MKFDSYEEFESYINDGLEELKNINLDYLEARPCNLSLDMDVLDSGRLKVGVEIHDMRRKDRDDFYYMIITQPIGSVITFSGNLFDIWNSYNHYWTEFQIRWGWVSQRNSHVADVAR